MSYYTNMNSYLEVEALCKSDISIKWEYIFALVKLYSFLMAH